MSKPDRPRVTASVEWEAQRMRTAGGGTVNYPPSVALTVDFDLHDHERALRLLESATADVRAQIEETR